MGHRHEHLDQGPLGFLHITAWLLKERADVQIGDAIFAQLNAMPIGLNAKILLQISAFRRAPCS